MHNAKLGIDYSASFSTLEEMINTIGQSVDFIQYKNMHAIYSRQIIDG